MFSHYLLAARLSLFLSSSPCPPIAGKTVSLHFLKKTWLKFTAFPEISIWLYDMVQETGRIFFFLQAVSLFFLVELRVGSELQMSKKSALGVVFSVWREDLWPAGPSRVGEGCSGTYTLLFSQGNVMIAFPLSRRGGPPAPCLDWGFWGQRCRHKVHLWGAQACSLCSVLPGRGACQLGS